MKFPPPLLIVVVLLISGCNLKGNMDGTASTGMGKLAQSSMLGEPKSYTKEARLIAVGDILMHMALTRSGYNPQKKTYTFNHFFKEVTDITSSGDWAIANLETPVAGPELGYSEYPLFNAPAQIVDAAKNAGFNVLTTANNHALDKGEKGVLNTIKNIRSRGVASVGTAASAKDAEQLLLVSKNNISMAILSYTYGTNGIPIPRGKNYLVSLIDERKIVSDIAKARKQGADVVTICLHFGEEYQRQPNAKQKQLTKSLIEAGADIILGSHPHVVQPYEIFKLKGKDGKPRTGVAIYSMGNFIAYQVGKYKDLGVIFEVNIRKRFPEGTIEITEVEATPTWTHIYRRNNKLNFRVLPIEAIVTSKNDPLLPATQYPVLEKQLREMKSHLESLTIPQETRLR